MRETAPFIIIKPHITHMSMCHPHQFLKISSFAWSVDGRSGLSAATSSLLTG